MKFPRRLSWIRLSSSIIIVFLTIALLKEKYLPVRADVQCHSQLVKEAIITVISGDPYIPGALVLGYTLHKYGAAKNRTMIAMIPHNTIINSQHIHLLETIGWRLIYVTALSFPGKVIPRLVDGLAKLHAWNMTQFSTIATIDPDAFLVGSIEEPFHIMRMSPGIPLAASENPQRMSKINVAQETRIFSYFNGGVLFIHPNMDDFKNLIHLSVDRSYYYDLDTPQQNLLNKYFRNRWLGLPMIYNQQFILFQERNYWSMNGNNSRIVHFTGSSKPWGRRSKSSLHEAMRSWRQEFCTMMKAYKWKLKDLFAGASSAFHKNVDFDGLNCDLLKEIR